MGLDMYLSKRTYVKNWDHYKPEQRHSVTVLRGGKPCDINPDRIEFIIESVAYWRKANAIHRWFVENVQEGRDECQESPVEIGKLKELVDLCKQTLATVETVPGDIKNGTTWFPDGRVEHHKRPGQIVAQKGIAASLLPTQGGFFFGETDYDEYYLNDLRETIKQLEPLLSDMDGEYYYRASW